MKCRKEHMCKWGIKEECDADEAEPDKSNKDPKRCFRCIARNYSEFELSDDYEEVEHD